MESLTKIKRGSMLFLVFMLISKITFGQIWDEFVRQKQTQLKYSLEQIVALKAYAEVAKKGYNMVSSGLNTVKDITNGEFKLHTVFINALKAVRPVIGKDARIAETIALQLGIKKSFNRSLNGQLSSSTGNYIRQVKDKVYEECNNDLDELLLVITSGRLEMSDDERLKRIEKIYQSTKEKAQFTQHFATQVSLLKRQKEIQQSLIKNIGRYYETE